MKKSSFIINVWDLLLSSWKKDEIEFKNELLEEIHGLDKNWISWSLFIQSFDKESLLVKLENVKWTIKENCDICTKKYIRTIDIDDYEAKFMINPDPNEDSEEPIFAIDKNENIDIKDMLTQAIILQEPFIKKCKSCKKNDNLQEDEEDLWYFEWSGNITFR